MIFFDGEEAVVDWSRDGDNTYGSRHYVQAAQQAGETASQAAGPGAWGTTIAIILAVGAATLGGMVGRNERIVLPGARTVVTTR